LRAIHKTYRMGAHVIEALQGVDLSVERGELLALTGPSGSGKSTLLNLCGLIDTPDSGEIELDAQPIRGLE
jgi:putative ABC transport system ATP-binding protein